MKKEAYISIKGLQDSGVDSDSIEVTTAGKFYDKDGKFYIIAVFQLKIPDCILLVCRIIADFRPI